MAITISGENNNDRILAQDGVIDSISGFNIAGIITATSFTGNLTGNVTGNLTGNVNSTSPLLLQTGGSERIRLTSNNEIGIAGANYGSPGQVLTSGGSGSAVSWASIPSQVTFQNAADNRIITSGGMTTLNGESTLTYDGTNFEQSTAGKFQIGNDNLSVAQSQLFHIRNNNQASQYFRNETTKSDHSYLAISLKAPNNDFQIWNQGSAGGGYGGTNSVNFYQSGGSFGPYGFYFGTTQALRINTNGQIVMGNSTTSTTRLDIRFTDTTAYSASSNHPNGLKIFNDCATDNGFAGIEIAATDGDDYYGSTLLKSIATGTNYSNDFAIQTRHGGTHAERLRITSSGLVGINENSPGTHLHVNSSTYNGVATFESTDAYAHLLIKDNSTHATGTYFGIHGNDFRWITHDGSNSAERVSIKASGKTLIGNDSNGNAPRTRLEVLENHVTGTGNLTPVMRLSTTSYGTEQGPQLQFGTTNVSYPTWTYGDIGAVYEGGSFGGAIVFRTNSGSSATAVSERGRWTRDGDLRIGDGNLVIATNGHGIDFSANTDLGGQTDHEVLDDYEEGYWTPTVGGSSGDGTTTYGNQKGNYVKIGSFVYLTFYLGWTSSTASGTFYIRGIPYQQISTYGTNYNITTGSIMFDSIQPPYQYGQLTLYQPHAANYLMFYGSYHTSGWSASSWSTNWTNGGTLIGSICYRAA